MLIRLAPQICQSTPAITGDSTSTRPPYENANRNPGGCSIASTAAVNPAAASFADATPACAARPAWNGLVIVPTLAIKPHAWEPARLNAIADCSADRPRNDAHAAAAPTAPQKPVGCQPLS